MRAAIVIGNWRDVHPRFAATTTGPTELVRADVNECVGVAVVGMFEDDDIFTAGVGAGEAKGEFVGFAAGVKEIRDF